MIPTTAAPNHSASGEGGHELLADWSRRYRTSLENYFRKRLPAPGEIEDLVQEVFLRLARQRELTAVRFIEPYLFQTASRVLTDHVRAITSRRRKDHEPYEEDAHATAVSSAESVITDRQTVTQLLKALAELPEKTRTVFMLRRWDELPNADIARMLGVSVSAVEKHITRALIHMKERMRDDP